MVTVLDKADAMLMLSSAL